MSVSRLILGMFTALVLLSCVEQRDQRYVHMGPDALPAESYERPPVVAFNRSDYAFKLEQMSSFYDVPGEAGYFIDGEDYGFDSLSFILTETHPNGGPPLHTHETEEAHVVLRGSMEYIIGDRRFSVQGPYVARVPAGVPHTFLNTGGESLNLTAIFPSKRLTYTVVGANPLVKTEPP
jgi:mannose-6-phosphate isomerase-like protein (cupin superfamily)